MAPLPMQNGENLSALLSFWYHFDGFRVCNLAKVF